ncbi:MAG: hypothetical protein WC588_00830 [Candidatus Micrarchaeia archaeon]
MGKTDASSKTALLALFLALAMLACGCTGSDGGQSGIVLWIFGWENLVAVALAATASLLGLAYIAASFVNDDKLKAWVKKEAGQLVFSIMIIICAIAIVDSMDFWLKTFSLAGSPAWQDYVGNHICCDPAVVPQCQAGLWKRPCHVELAMDHLQFVYETLRKNVMTYLWNYSAIATLANLHTSINIMNEPDFGSLSLSPLTYLSAGVDYFTILIGLATKAMMMTRTQQAALDYLHYPVFGAFMSMGLVLRILPFTRKLGGMLIAISLSLYVVLPMFYVLNSAILWGFIAAPAGGTPSTVGASYDTGAYTPGYGAGEAENYDAVDPENVLEGGYVANIDVCNSTGADAEQARAERQQDEGFIQSNWKMMRGTKWHAGLQTMLTGPGLSYDGPLGVLAMIMVFSTVLPFLGLMTSLAAFKVLSPLLGGDVELGLLSRLI